MLLMSVMPSKLANVSSTRPETSEESTDLKRNISFARDCIPADLGVKRS